MSLDGQLLFELGCGERQKLLKGKVIESGGSLAYSGRI